MQRVKVCVSIPVRVLVYEEERTDHITYASSTSQEHLNVEGVVEVESGLKDSERVVAALRIALESLEGILSAEMARPGMLGGAGRGR